MAPIPDTPKRLGAAHVCQVRVAAGSGATAAALAADGGVLGRVPISSSFGGYVAQFDLSPGPDAALDAIAEGNSATTIAQLAKLETALTSRPGPAALRARGLILAISEALTQHASYFDGGPAE